MRVTEVLGVESGSLRKRRSVSRAGHRRFKFSHFSQRPWTFCSSAYWKQMLEKLTALPTPKNRMCTHQGVLPMRLRILGASQRWHCVVDQWEKYSGNLQTCTTNTMDYYLHCNVSSMILWQVSHHKCWSIFLLQSKLFSERYILQHCTECIGWDGYHQDNWQPCQQRIHRYPILWAILPNCWHKEALVHPPWPISFELAQDKFSLAWVCVQTGL